MQQTKTYKQNIPGIIALCLVLAVLFCYTGGLVAWNVARKVSYEYVRGHRSELKFNDTIIVSSSTIKGNEELNWIKDDEIRYLGRMYDIKKLVTLPDGRIMLVGHYDDWDSKLFKSLERMLEPPPGQNHPKEHRFFWLVADAVIPVDHQLGHVYPKIVAPHFSKVDHHFHTIYRPDVPVPPPNVCFA